MGLIVPDCYRIDFESTEIEITSFEIIYVKKISIFGKGISKVSLDFRRIIVRMVK